MKPLTPNPIDYINLVHKIAQPYRGTQHTALSYDDIIGSGLVGLMKACKDYNHTKSCHFSAYARLRIIGEIKDDLRRHDLMSRRDRAKHLASGNEEPAINIASIDAADFTWIEDRWATEARGRNDDEMDVETILTAFSKLPMLQREMMQMSYIGKLNLKQAAAEVGMTESRMCQVRKEALSKLRVLCVD